MSTLVLKAALAAGGHHKTAGVAARTLRGATILADPETLVSHLPALTLCI